MARGKVQISEIAGMAGVSASTVSIVLNGKGDEMRISRQTQEKIRSIASELGYLPNLAARSLRNGSIGASHQVFAFFVNIEIIRTVDGDYFSSVIAEFYLSMKERGLDAEIVVNPYFSGKLSEYREYFTSNRYSGIIIYSASDADLAFLMENDFPTSIVLINRETNGKYMNVRINDYEGGKECARIFAENGHKRAVIAGIKESSLSMRMRKMGFLDGCRQYGIELRDGDIISYSESGRSGDGSFITEIISRPDHPTAFLIYSADLAYAAVTACRLSGIRIPQDVEIIVFGNGSSVQYCSPGLTSFSPSDRDIAGNALDLLLLSKNNPSLSVSKTSYLSFHFRESCRRPSSFA